VGNILNSTNGAVVSLAKSGTGILSLDGDVGCTGTTTVSAGTLLVNGTLPSSALTMANNTTLGGAGIIGSAVTIPLGGTLAAGAGVGMLTVNNNVTLQTGSTTRVELDKAAGTNDQLNVAGLLSYGGSLIVTNLGGTLWAGDAFHIFNASSTTGSFSAISLPPLPTGFNWQWNPASGTISIISTVALNPTNLTANFLPAALQLSWPDDHIGWRIETNAVDITDPNSWFTLNGSSNTNQVFLPINPASSQVFFRMVFP
jgi:autotransporter-associated beta strand protein